LIISIDDVATGLLVDAISVAGRRLGTAAGAARSGRGREAEELAVARWFETYELTSRTPGLSALSDKSAERLRALLSGDDAQAAVQELLAVRLTDGSNEDARRARQAFALTLAGTNDPEISRCAAPLANYYDDEICELVGRLGDTPLLAQIRSEALSARMIAVLHAIERHTAALSTRPALRTEADFLTRYRAHVLDQHGKLEPPDFERRRRVPIADIYVPTVIYEENHPDRGQLTPDAEPPSLTVWELAGRLDRSVLLGDPGSGKTTASTVLMYHFASASSRRVPFLVTLRNFAGDDPPARSVVGHIEHVLETLYQCPAPPGLVDLLLLSGRAVVLFDGLDELLDTSWRADVATRVEQFGIEYPLAPILVTSRVVGYDQARLDVHHFTSYRLGGLRDEDVAEYARKWFALEDATRPNDADVFLTESESIPDLRAAPLLLSLMCILYRGEGSLPRNRAEVYEQCANLLFRRWDARRRIHQELLAGHLVEPALRHLAWWLFTRDDSQTAVTARELATATTEFLHGRGFESLDIARDAAREFVEFCRGRMWVFSDTGSTAIGEPLYTFTHRTFLEYFAAAWLAYDSDTPESLARTLAPHVAGGEWEIVSELAIQIKDSTSRDGAKRIYEDLLNERQHDSLQSRSRLLQFLARSLRSVDPSPQVTRHLTREVVDFIFSGDPDSDFHGLPFAWLLASCNSSLTVVSEEISTYIAEMIGANDTETRLKGLRLAASLDVPLRGNWGGGGPDLPKGNRLRSFWEGQSDENLHTYREAIITAAVHHTDIRSLALWENLITIDQALKMSDGLRPLLRVQCVGVFGLRRLPLLLNDFFWLANEGHSGTRYAHRATRDLMAVGRYLVSNPQFPWTTGSARHWSDFIWDKISTTRKRTHAFDPLTYLGGAAVFLMSAERDSTLPSHELESDPTRLGPFNDLYPYVEFRHVPESALLLPDLPVPEEFKQVFKDWALGRVNFIGSAPDSPDVGDQQAQ
jgi:hypothetical protein